MVSWFLLIIAMEIGVMVGFIMAAAIAFSQIKKFNANILNHQLYCNQKISLFLRPNLKEKE